MRKLFFVALLATLFSCKKDDSLDKSLTNELLTIEQIAKLKAELATDQDFLSVFMIDRELVAITVQSRLENSNSQIVTLTQKQIDDIAASENKLYSYLQTFMGEVDAKRVLDLLKSKQVLLSRVKIKYPSIKNATPRQIGEIIGSANKQIAGKRAFTAQRGGCNGNKCCNSYVNAMSDCTTDFAIETAGAILIGAGTTIVGTPIGGAWAMSGAIGIAYGLLLRCESSAARDYRDCMGYH